MTGGGADHQTTRPPRGGGAVKRVNVVNNALKYTGCIVHGLRGEIIAAYPRCVRLKNQSALNPQFRMVLRSAVAVCTESCRYRHSTATMHTHKDFDLQLFRSLAICSPTLNV